MSTIMNQKQRKKGLRCVYLLACILVMLSTSVESQAATGKPSLSKKKLHMNVGKQERLSVKNQEGYMVSWKSSKKAVVTVSKTGKLKAKKSGSARITAVVKPDQGGKTYRLVCKVSVKKGKRQVNSNPATPDQSVPEQPIAASTTPDQPAPGQPIEASTTPDQPVPEQPIAAPATPDQPSPEQSIEASTSPDQPSPGQPIQAPMPPDQPSPEQPTKAPAIPEQPLPSQPADSTTGSAVAAGEGRLLFGNYNDGLTGNAFFGNQMIDSYEQLQNLIQKANEDMESNTWQYGRDRMQWYINQMEAIEQDYFTDHVLCINTMMVARGYDYTLDFAAKVVEGDGSKALHLWLKRHYSLKEGECVTCDMPYYSFFIQVPRELVQECESVVCSLVDSEERIPSDDPELPYVTPDILWILEQVCYPLS